MRWGTTTGVWETNRETADGVIFAQINTGGWYESTVSHSQGNGRQCQADRQWTRQSNAAKQWRAARLSEAQSDAVGSHQLATDLARVRVTVEDGSMQSHQPALTTIG